jgi:hypothetical protein
MIIGRGDIARVLPFRDDLWFMASGVSNSKCEDVNEYERELKLLMSIPVDKHLVYFSSLSIYYGKTMYTNHKMYMEKLIQSRFQSYTIVRLGNITWGKNPNTLINYLKAHPEAELQNTYRHIVSLDEFKYWISLIKSGIKDVMNIAGRMIFVPDLMKEIHDTNINWFSQGSDSETGHVIKHKLNDLYSYPLL